MGWGGGMWWGEGGVVCSPVDHSAVVEEAQ